MKKPSAPSRSCSRTWSILGPVDVTVAEGRKALGDRITIMAGVQQLCGPMDDRAAVRASIHQMIREVEPWDHFILGVAGYPNRTMEQTRFVVDCCRDQQGARDRQDSPILSLR